MAINLDYGFTKDGITVGTGAAARPRPRKAPKLATPVAPAIAAAEAEKPKRVTAIFRIPKD